MARYRLARAFALTILFGSASLGCGTETTTLLSPSPLAGRCGVTLDVSSPSIGAAGGTGTVRIQTDRECSWALPQQPPWVKLSQPATTQGPAEVAFVVDENRSTSLRSWEVVVADQRVLISQEAATCTVSVSPAQISIGAAGGDAQAVLTTEDFCSWEAPSPASWIAITPERGQGPAEITVRVSRNTGATRTNKLKVSSAAIEIAQKEAPPPPTPTPVPPTPAPPAPARPAPAPPPAPAPCTFSVEVVSFTDIAAAASTLKVDVKTEAGCTWTSQSGVDWLQVPSGMKTGSGRVEVSVSLNSGPARSATVVVAGQSVTVEQHAAIICSVTLTPASFTPSASGASVSVTLNSPAGCAWTVTGAPNWVTVSPVSGTGSKTLKIAAAANSGAARAAALVIGEREFRIEQAQLPACTYAVTPERFTVSYRKQNRKIVVTTLSHCQWTATSSASWAVVSSVPRTGSGETELKIDENYREANRSAVVTIAGQNFTKEVAVTQEGDDD